MLADLTETDTVKQMLESHRPRSDAFIVMIDGHKQLITIQYELMRADVVITPPNLDPINDNVMVN